MMSEEIKKFRIHFTVNGVEDYIDLEGTVKQVRAEATVEVDRRGGKDPWSEVINP